MLSKKIVVALFAVTVTASIAAAQMRITEFMYKGEGGEFAEFTNMGGAPVDMTGWSYADSHYPDGDPEFYDLSAFGTVAPGESVILTEDPAMQFRMDWGLDASVKIIGDLGSDLTGGDNMGGDDTINLLDAAMNVIDTITYSNDVVSPNGFSANPATPAAIGADDYSQWVLASVGDSFGSWASITTDVGNPGVYVPEPASLVLLAIAGLAIRRR